jgi:hypothetical protein
MGKLFHELPEHLLRTLTLQTQQQREATQTDRQAGRQSIRHPHMELLRSRRRYGIVMILYREGNCDDPTEAACTDGWYAGTQRGVYIMYNTHREFGLRFHLVDRHLRAS